VIARLKDADADGLDVSDYRTPNFAGLGPDALAEADLKLTQTVLTFARHLQAGRFPYKRVNPNNTSYRKHRPSLLQSSTRSSMPLIKGAKPSELPVEQTSVFIHRRQPLGVQPQLSVKCGIGRKKKGTRTSPGHGRDLSGTKPRCFFRVDIRLQASLLPPIHIVSLCQHYYLTLDSRRAFDRQLFSRAWLALSRGQ
jgi:hypothetical protein